MVAQTSVNTAHCCRLKSLWISCCKDWQMPLFLIKFPACDAWLFLQLKLFTETPKSSDKFALQRAFYKKYAVFVFQTLMKKRIECFLLLFQEYTNKSSLSVISVDVFFVFFFDFLPFPRTNCHVHSCETSLCASVLFLHWILCRASRCTNSHVNIEEERLQWSGEGKAHVSTVRQAKIAQSSAGSTLDIISQGNVN